MTHRLDKGDVIPWDQMVEKFMKIHFPKSENANKKEKNKTKQRRDITYFEQKDREH